MRAFEVDASTPPGASRVAYRAIVFDLFGTLVDAPTAAQRKHAAGEIGAAVSATADAVDAVLLASWPARHQALATVGALAGYLIARLSADATGHGKLTEVLHRQGQRQLRTEPSVLATLEALQRAGIRIGVLSDACADVAHSWAETPLARCVDAAIFSCTAGATKPDRSLYNRVLHQLGIPPHQTLYCGDGGGDELRGALNAGMADAVRVARRGGAHGLVYGDQPWNGPHTRAIEDLAAIGAGAHAAAAACDQPARRHNPQDKGDGRR